jgi:hypothetical protein
MTTFEHAMLGANAVLACGLHRKLGWRVVGLAGFAAIGPDWDGPVSDWSVVYSMVPWGNVGVTVIFAASMILMAKFTRFIQPLAAGSLVAVVAYIIVWGSFCR